MAFPDYVRSLPVVALYTAAIYLLLIGALRLLGRRQLGQLTVIDLVIVLILGSAVETAMVDGNVSLPAGFVSAAVLLLANRVISRLASRSRRIRRLVAGSPVLVVAQGRTIEEHLRRCGLTEDDVLQALRERGFCDISDVRFAVMEEDGEINAVACDHPAISTTLPPAATTGDSPSAR